MEAVEEQKITVNVPRLLLDEARKVAGKGITQTVIEGLEKVALSKKYRDLASLQGKYPEATIDLDALREDREF